MPAALRIVLLHATPVAIDPVEAAFAELWPEPEIVNLLDDSLSPDRAREPELSEAMIDRFVAFGRYALSAGADAILVTCSAFGPAIDVMARGFPVPVLKPNEAMFHAAIARGSRIGMIATFGPSIPTMRQEFEEHKAAIGATATLETILVEEAMTALRAGDADGHNRRIAERARELEGVNTIMLAHFSTSRARAAVQSKVSEPVHTAPGAAVTRLRTLIEGR
jgi:Asp/Glu/hydantoin racemase